MVKLTNQQIETLYDTATVNYNREENPQQRVRSLKVWKRYIGDLDYQKVEHAIDQHNMSSIFPARPAELRTRILAPDLPTPEQALIEAKQLTTAIETGAPIPPTHQLVRQTIEQAGVTHDLDFKELYKTNRAEYLTQHLPTNGP